MDAQTTVALGDMPSPQERRETGRIAISIVQLVKAGRAEPLHALLSTLTVREIALTLGALGALVCAYGDQLDSVCLGQGLPVMASDVLRQWLNVLDGLPADDGQCHD